MKYSNHFAVCFIFTFLACFCKSQVIPPSRATNWTLAGYHGSIPVYDTLKNITDFGGSGNGIALNDLALQNAIAALGSQNGTIYFPAGTYLFNSPVSLRSGLILKGAGSANSILQFNLGGLYSLITVEGNATTSVATVTATMLKGGNVLTVDDASLFSLNDYIKIYQNDADLVEDPGDLETVGQVLHIENISGNTITFSSPLRRNYLLVDEPKIRRLTMVTGVGIECLKIKRIDAASPLRSNLFFRNTAKCWVKGVESDSCNYAHVRIASSTNIEITNCYFHGAFSYGASGEGYGVDLEFTAGECLIENNIFSHLRHSMLLQSGANGNVLDYNYSVGAVKSESIPYDLVGDIVMHGNYPYMNLAEGNIVQNIFVDAAHGINGPYNTIFRNRAQSYGIIISAGAGDSTSFVGNEITGTGFGKGNYLMMGRGNFEFGNNRNNTIVPGGTTTLPDQSYIYSSKPAFWDIAAAWPPVGIPNALNSGTVPAKERFTGGTAFTSCRALPEVYTFTGNGNWNISANWMNGRMPPSTLSNGSEIIIDPPAAGNCILNILYAVSSGSKLTVASGKSFVVQGNLTIVQ